MAYSSFLGEEDLKRFRTKPCLRSKQCSYGKDRCQFSHSTEWPRRCPYYVSRPRHSLRYLPSLCPNVILGISNSDSSEGSDANRLIIGDNLLNSGSVGTKKCGLIEDHNAARANNNCLRQGGTLPITADTVNALIAALASTAETRSFDVSVIRNVCSKGGSCVYAHSLEEILYHPLIYKTHLCQVFRHGFCGSYYCPFVHGTAEMRHPEDDKFSLPFTDECEMDLSAFPNVMAIGRSSEAPLGKGDIPTPLVSPSLALQTTPFLSVSSQPTASLPSTAAATEASHASTQSQQGSPEDSRTRSTSSTPPRLSQDCTFASLDFLSPVAKPSHQDHQLKYEYPQVSSGPWYKSESSDKTVDLNHCESSFETKQLIDSKLDMLYTRAQVKLAFLQQHLGDLLADVTVVAQSSLLPMDLQEQVHDIINTFSKLLTCVIQV